MKNKDKPQNTVLEGYNPKVYRQLSIMFIILTILNIAAIVYAFARTGYGLWHAEDALSCIAKIEGSFKDINTSILDIELHADDQNYISRQIDNIVYYHQDITENADKFRSIDISNVDATISSDFESFMNKVGVYYSIISENLSDIRDGTAKLTILHDEEAEKLRTDAINAINALFNKADSATYIFFCRVAQRFLFVVLFLLLTMTAGLIAISRSKKKDLKIALQLQSSKQKTAKVIQKAEVIAYTNVTTGLKNRYALTEHLDQRMKLEDISIALYNFNNFKSLNEQYGREFADDFIAAVSRQVVEHFGQDAEIFTTEADELCVVFNKDVPKTKINNLSEELLCALSQAYQVNGVVVQLTVAGVIAHLAVNSFTSASRLFIAFDHRMRHIKSLCVEQSRSLIMPLQ